MQIRFSSKEYCTYLDKRLGVYCVIYYHSGFKPLRLLFSNTVFYKKTAHSKEYKQTSLEAEKLYSSYSNVTFLNDYFFKLNIKN